jgi:6-phosphogluconolactonase
VVLRVAPRVHVFPDLDAASEELARRLVERARASVRAGGGFRLVISGGSTPLGLFARLAGEFRREVPWSSTDLYFADERCVVPRDPESNFGAAWRTFLSKVPIRRAHVHRMRGELRPITEGARRYAKLLGPLPDPDRGDSPLFDLVLLGIGPDGHTASLFPGQASVNERRSSVVAVPHAGQPPHVPRLTLTVPALSSARAVWFLVAGADKAAALSKVLRATRSPLPAARIRPPEPVEWFVDRSAYAAGPSSAGPAT